MKFLSLVVLCVCLVGCRAELKIESKPTPIAEKVYVCPMECVPPSNEAGDCSVCGMDLVEKKS